MSDSLRTQSTIYPGLSYDDPAAAIDWLCRAFGFTKRLVIPGPNGTIVHSELSHGEGVIMVGSARPDENRFSPRSLPGVNQAISVSVDDPDSHFAVAKAAGAEIIQGLEDSDYRSRGYAAKDPEGHHWHFATYRPGGYWNGHPVDSPPD